MVVWFSLLFLLSVGRSALQEVLRLHPECVVMVVLSLQFLPLPVIRFLRLQALSARTQSLPPQL